MKQKKVAVIGLGRFGLSLASDLTDLGVEVLAIDSDEDRVEKARDRVAQAVIADGSDEKTLAQLGIRDFDAVVIAIGESFEASIVVAAHLQELKIKRIISRVVSPVHERVLLLMGIDELIRPEREAAFHMSRVLTIKGIIESVKIGGEYSVIEAVLPKWTEGKTLSELNLRNDFQINLVTVIREEAKGGVLGIGQRREKACLGVPLSDLKFEVGDILVLFGKDQHIQAFLDKIE